VEERHDQVRAIDSRAGKAREAVQWAQDAANWINERQPGSNLQVFREVFGHAGTLYWVGDAENVAMIEQRTAEREADPEWQVLVERCAGLFLPGSIRDTLLRSA
jgi:hypothetical protein